VRVRVAAGALAVHAHDVARLITSQKRELGVLVKGRVLPLLVFVVLYFA